MRSQDGVEDTDGGKSELVEPAIGANVQHRSRDALGVERPLLATLYGRGNRASTTPW